MPVILFSPQKVPKSQVSLPHFGNQKTEALYPPPLTRLEPLGELPDLSELVSSSEMQGRSSACLVDSGACFTNRTARWALLSLQEWPRRCFLVLPSLEFWCSWRAQLLIVTPNSLLTWWPCHPSRLLRVFFVTSEAMGMLVAAPPACSSSELYWSL